MKILNLLLFTFLLFGKTRERIISLAPSITEQLYLLNVGDRIVGNTTYCIHPPDARKKEKVGTILRIDVEKIIALNPDIIIATPLTPSVQLRILRRKGIEVVCFEEPKSFEEMCEQFLKIGELVGKKQIAKLLIKKIKGHVNSIKGKSKTLKKRTVFVQIGAKPLFTVPRHSYINDLIDFAGGVSISSTAVSGLYSREKVIAKNPDVILIADMGIVGETEKKIWMKYKTINAVKNKRVYIIDSHELCNPTPTSFLKVLRKIFKILHRN